MGLGGHDIVRPSTTSSPHAKAPIMNKFFGLILIDFLVFKT
jgi:hypothetical protein